MNPAVAKLMAMPPELRARELERINGGAAVLSRKNINTFMSFVVRDEATNLPIKQSPTHVRMQRLASANKRLILWSHTEAGKTVQLCVGRPLWYLGNNPAGRIAIISNTHEQAAKVVRTIASYVETSSELKMVFPDMKKGEPWTSHHLFLRREVTSREPSVQACGVHGNITGSRIDLMIWDDILDPENTRTAAGRQDLYDWLFSAAVWGRLTKNARVIVCGNAYHPDDVLHRLSRVQHWKSVKLPVLDSKGRSTWPSHWSSSRIRERKLELGPKEFARQMMCEARDDAESRFKQEWIDVCCLRGRGLKMIETLRDLYGTPMPAPMVVPDWLDEEGISVANPVTLLEPPAQAPLPEITEPPPDMPAWLRQRWIAERAAERAHAERSRASQAAPQTPPVGAGAPAGPARPAHPQEAPGAPQPPPAPAPQTVAMVAGPFAGTRIGDALARQRAPYGLIDVIVPVLRIYTGIDLAVQTHASADYTVLFTIGVHPDGTRQVLHIERGKWTGPDVVRRIGRTFERFESDIWVENVAGQDYIRQFAAERQIPTHGYTTGRQKAHPEFGIESLASELARGQWVFPVGREWAPGEPVDNNVLEQLFTEILYYDPKSHTGDTLMGMFLARHGANRLERSAGSRTIGFRVIG